MEGVQYLSRVVCIDDGHFAGCVRARADPDEGRQSLVQVTLLFLMLLIVLRVNMMKAIVSRFSEVLHEFYRVGL